MLTLTRLSEQDSFCQQVRKTEGGRGRKLYFSSRSVSICAEKGVHEPRSSRSRPTSAGASPLELVVCQIRFDSKAAAEEPAVALSFHEQLGGEGGRYQKMEPIAGQEYSIAMGPNTAPATEAKSLAGWRLDSAKDGWVISLTGEYVAIETSAYRPGMTFESG